MQENKKNSKNDLAEKIGGVLANKNSENTKTNIKTNINSIKTINGKLVLNQLVQPGFYDMEIFAPEIAKSSRPGQFLMIKPNQQTAPLLGRPMGIYDWNAERGTINILYGVKHKGSGTDLLSKAKPGAILPIVAPLGRGYQFVPTDKQVVVVAGGVGIAPLFPVIKELLQAKVKVEILIGAPTAERVLSMEKLANLTKLGLSGMNLTVFTDDGSMGNQGYPTDALKYLLASGKYQRVYCCGSMVMMESISLAAEAAAVPCQVSLEERMGCGIGICMGCVCQHKNLAGAKELVRVCYEGPVFDSKEVIWHG